MALRFANLFLVVAALAGSFGQAFGQSGANVLLVINESSTASLQIGNYYAQKRAIPSGNILRLRLSANETVERAEYERQLEVPIETWLTRNFAQDRILYIVLTKGIPLRISATTGNDAVVSVDSELTLAYRKLTGAAVPATGRLNNPYFLEGGSSQTKSFTHENEDIFLVTRLDGYTVADVRALIDRGLAPVKEGSIILDDKASSASDANGWLKAAAEKLKGRQDQNRVIYDTTVTVIKDVDNVLGYYSWGSNDPAIRDRHLNLKFANGALAAMFVNSDARTLKEPPSDWKIGQQDDPATHFEGSPQSLIGDFIRDGVTGAAGHVAEPDLDAAIRPDILFPAYFSGANLAEAFYQAMPYLSRQTVIIGDPLCAPFRVTSLTSSDIDKGPDYITELPQFFSAARLKAVSSPALNPDGVDSDVMKLLLRADSKQNKRDLVGMRQALEDATSRNKRLGPATISLGLLYEQSGEYDKAIERYRSALEMAPTNVLVLNNLAYGLAVRKKLPQEALPFAEKAYSLAPKNAGINDTLAWVRHLGGNDRQAVGLLAEALQLAPQDATIHLHAAVVNAALGENETAQRELAKALQLDPKLAGADDVVQLRTKLKP